MVKSDMKIFMIIYFDWCRSHIMNRCLHGPQVKNHIGVWHGDDGFPELSCICKGKVNKCPCPRVLVKEANIVVFVLEIV